MASIFSNAGRALIVNRIMGTGTEPKYIGWGTGAGTAAVTDTTLFSEKALDGSSTTGTRTTGTSSAITTTVTNDTHNVAGTLTATGTITVTNAGTFDNSSIGSGTLGVKGDFTGVSLNSGDSLTLTFKTQLA